MASLLFSKALNFVFAKAIEANDDRIAFAEK